MFQKTKTDPSLGLEVENHLKKLGLNTPTIYNKWAQASSHDKIETLEKLFTEVHNVIGLDLQDDSICGTPKRLAKMWVLEKFWGLDPENFPKSMTIDNKIGYDQMIIEKKIKVMSCCEHHWENIHGYATVAYIPYKKVVGLSKINRIVDYFSHRPQVQERLTQQIAETLRYVLETEDVAVYIDARHYCVISRGIEDMNSSTSTLYVGGRFRENLSMKQEFLGQIESIK